MEKNITMGMDLGDKYHEICVLDADGKVILREQITNTKESAAKFFKKY